MRLAASLAAALVLVTLTACDESDNIKSNEIVEAIPWTAPESARYRVLDDDDDEVGTLEMSIERDADTFVLRQYYDFAGNEFVNDAVVVVDAETLMPLTTNYTIDGPEGTITCEALYEGGKVQVHNVRTDGERDDDLDVPNFRYDSWSDLFLWRTIRFTQGYDIEYADVVACQSPAPPDLIGAKLKVTGGDMIEVPAGSFDTWKVEIDAVRDQDAWFTTDESHTLVKYDNGEVVFELVDAP